MARCAMVSRLRPGWWSKLKSSSDLRAGNPAARVRSSAPEASRAATSRERTAARYSSWVQPASRAWSASRAAASRIRGAFMAAGVVLICLRFPWRRSSGDLPVIEDDAEGPVVVGQVPHRPAVSAGAGLLERFPQAGPPLDVGRIGDRSVPAPRPGMVPDASAVQADPDGVQVCGDLDEPADRLRVDGVVVGAHPDVVVPREPDPAGEPGHRRNRRQRQHRRPVRARSGRPGGRRRPDQPGVGLGQPLPRAGR